VLLSVRETATILSLTGKTVRRLIAAGRLPALQLGSSIRIPENELRAWLESEPAKTLAERLGHAKASMSLDVYTHTLDRERSRSTSSGCGFSKTLKSTVSLAETPSRSGPGVVWCRRNARKPA
jgi:excisionase family DNA binding protein